MSCVRCGKCCTDPTISIEIKNEDLARFYAGFGIEVSIVGDKFKARFHTGTVCRLFSRDKDGKGSCDIYDDRPQICRDYPPGGVGKHLGCGYS